MRAGLHVARCGGNFRIRAPKFGEPEYALLGYSLPDISMCSISAPRCLLLCGSIAIARSVPRQQTAQVTLALPDAVSLQNVVMVELRRRGLVK